MCEAATAAPEHVSIKPGFPSDAAEAGLKRVRVTSRIAGLGSGWRWAGGVTYANVSWQCGLFFHQTLKYTYNVHTRGVHT